MRFLLVSLCFVGLSYGAEQEKMAKMEQGSQGAAPAVGQQLQGTTQFQQQPFVTSGQVGTHSLSVQIVIPVDCVFQF